jgi:hypothetical protein
VVPDIWNEITALKDKFDNIMRGYDMKIGESEAKFSGLTIFENKLFTNIYQLLIRGLNILCFTQRKNYFRLKNKVYI